MLWKPKLKNLYPHEKKTPAEAIRRNDFIYLILGPIYMQHPWGQMTCKLIRTLSDCEISMSIKLFEIFPKLISRMDDKVKNHMFTEPSN